MPHVVLAALLGSVGAPGLPAHGQAPADFSGAWTVVADVSTPAGRTAFGEAFTALQDDALLVLDLTTLYLIGENRLTSRHPRLRYRLDGRPTRLLTQLFDSPLELGGSRTAHASGSTVGGSEATARWEGRQLVITTATTRRVSSVGSLAAAWTVETTLRQTLYLSEEGFLVVETSIADTTPAARLAGPSFLGLVRTVYRRQ